MGALLCAKFSAVFLLPVAAALLMAAVRWTTMRQDEISGRHLGARLKPSAGEWLRRTAPGAIVGHSLYVYDIDAK